MTEFRVLIVEDEPLIAMELEDAVARIVSAIITTVNSVSAAKQVLDEPLHFAFLDIDVTDGKTFEVARLLKERHVPCVFVSASAQDELPLELHEIPFIPKPFHPTQIEHVIYFVNAKSSDAFD